MKLPGKFVSSLVGGLALVATMAVTGVTAETRTDETPTEWRSTPGVFEVNRLPASVRTIPVLNTPAALTAPEAASPYYRSLNGTWRFQWSPDPLARPTGFHGSDYDDSGWARLQVPHNWQVDGYGEIYYLNQEHPWQGYGRISPPEVPVEHNEVGSYRRDFTVPGSWKGRRVVLAFQGVKSAFYVWINGELVGYSEDSYSPAEFDVTEAVQPGRNTIAVEVYRWSDGAWLENQDMLDISGIFRDVELYSTPQVHLHDHTVRTDFDATYDDATLEVDAEVTRTAQTPSVPYELRAQLYDARRRPVLAEPMSAELEFTGDTVTVQLARDVDSPAPWSAERPNLYTLVFQLVDGDGDVVETTSTRVGFREFGLEGGQMVVNGQPFDIKGVNRHEMHPDVGQALTPEQIREDIVLMKRHNIDAVRVAHYPAHPEFYRLADELGLYVLDEANLESHDMRPFPGNNPDWYEPVFDRVRSMYERDKNHPSVLLWSLGNEVGSGEVFRDMADWLHQVDPTRLIHFQQDNSLADVNGSFYPSLATLEGRGRAGGSKPWIMSEYEHAMGNSIGNIAEYWEIIDAYPILQGGFIWDWVDQSIRLPVDGGVDGLPVPQGTREEDTFFGYGGDWGDYPHDESFHLNGLVSPDRRVQPELLDVKAVYADVDTVATDLANGRVRLRNEFLFTGLDAFNARWTLHADDELLDEGTLDLDIAPQSEAWVDLPFEPSADPAPGTEYWFTLTLTLPRVTDWAPAGHEIASLQYRLPWDTPPQPAVRAPDGPSLTVADSSATVEVTGADFGLTFAKETGAITSFRHRGRELLAVGPEPNFWRPPTQNDGFNGTATRNAVWRDAGRELRVDDVTVREVSDDAVHIQVDGTVPTPNGSTYRVGYFVFGTGDVLVRSTVAPDTALSELPAFGMTLSLPAGFDQLTWYGRGPQENYWDRHDGANVGAWSADVADLFFPHVVPQETGNHTGVRWATLTDGSGAGLLVAGAEPFEVTALHQSQQAIEQAGHPYQVTADDVVHVTVNHRQMGVGNSWSAPALSQYMLDARQPWSFQYLLRPVTRADDRSGLANRTQDLDLLADIRVDGESLDGFHTDVTSYTLTFSAAVERPVPVVEAVPASDDVHVEVTQADDVPGTATVEATSADGLVWARYVVHFEEVSHLFLSDVDWVSATVGFGTPGRDVTIEGNPIQLLGPDGVETYAKGLGVHADSEIVYDLSAWQFDVFEAVVGMEQHANRDGRRFVFEVWVDDQLAWASPVMIRSTPAIPIQVDVSGADELRLIMRQAGDGIGHGHGAWGDARLTVDEPPDS